MDIFKVYRRSSVGDMYVVAASYIDAVRLIDLHYKGDFNFIYKIEKVSSRSIDIVLCNDEHPGWGL